MGSCGQQNRIPKPVQPVLASHAGTRERKRAQSRSKQPDVGDTSGFKAMKRINAKRSAQAGQAMAEFLVSMIAVMSVLFLGIVMLGKFNDVRNRTLMGSRYVAWERTVW